MKVVKMGCLLNMKKDYYESNKEIIDKFYSGKRDKTTLDMLKSN